MFENKTGAWAALSWRYDSGLVAGAVASLDDALALTAVQQTAIGFFCGNQVATRDQALTSATCTSLNHGATRLKIPAEGTADDVSNPPRVAPRHLLDLCSGADNLLHTDRTKLRVRFSIINLTNKDARYNFLSTFSGTDFVTPRASQLSIYRSPAATARTARQLRRCTLLQHVPGRTRLEQPTNEAAVVVPRQGDYFYARMLSEQEFRSRHFVAYLR